MPMTNCEGPYRNLDTVGAFMAFLVAQQITIRESLGSTPVFRGFRYSGAACQPRLQFPRADTVQAMCLNSKLTPPRQRNTQRSTLMKIDSIIVATASAVVIALKVST